MVPVFSLKALSGVNIPSYMMRPLAFNIIVNVHSYGEDYSIGFYIYSYTSSYLAVVIA